MHGVKLEQMRVCLKWGKVVDRDNLKIAHAAFRQGPQHIAADPPKAVDGQFYCHGVTF